MFQDTRPAGLGDAEPEAWSQFRIDHIGEIGALMRQLRDSATPLVLGAPGGAALVTELWSMDLEQERLHFSADDNNPALGHLVDCDEAVAVGYLDAVKLQFDLQDLMVVRGPRSCTLQSRLPSVLYRFQRRGAYRVRTLDRHSPLAQLRHPALPDMKLTLRVIDVSIGGCALFLPHDVPLVEPGVRLHGVQIELDAETRFSAALQIQHISSISSQDGLRAGCEWMTLPPESQRALQRYIDQTQKRRRLLSLD